MSLLGKIATLLGFRSRETDLVSIVLHFRQRASFSEELIRSAIVRAWEVSADGDLKESVVAKPPLCFVKFDGIVLLLTNAGRPYCPPQYLEGALAQFPEERQKRVARDHKAFMTIDLLTPKRPSRSEKRKCYRRIASLAAELLDDNCMGVYIPETGYMCPNDGQILNALRSNRPVVEIERL
jgi:hypothetical protein